MARYFIEVMYNGTQFHGSQLQGNTPTVQLEINKTLSLLLRMPVTSVGASRTDEGVHALCNFYHFDSEEPLHAAFQYKMNAILPEGVAIKKLYTSPDPDMNARFAAIRRRYRYRIYHKKDPFKAHRVLYFPYRLQKELLHQTADIIKEYNHFESFAKRNMQSKTFTCNIFQSYWEEHDGELHYVVEANRFLRGMVRGLVGTQLNVAREKTSVAGFREIIESNDNTKAFFNVAGHGLYLEEISYPSDAGLIEIK